MRLLVRYLRAQRRSVVAALLCAAAGQGFLLLEPLIFRHLIDRYALRAGRLTTADFLWQVGALLGAMVGAAFFGWLAKNFQLLWVSRVTRSVGMGVYCDAIRSSLGMPYAAFEDRRSGEVMAKIQTARHDVELLVPALINTVFGAAIALAFVCAYAASAHWLLGAAYLLIAPALALMSWTMGTKVRTVREAVVRETAELAGSAAESIRNIELIKSLGLADREMLRVRRSGDRVLELELEHVRHVRNLGFFQGVCTHTLRAGLLFLMLYMVFAGRLTVGQFFSLFLYSYFIVGPLQELGAVATLYYATEASLRHVAGILAAPQEARPHRATEVGPLRVLAFEGVTFRYAANAAPALRAVSFEVARGETVAFVGPSGAGKSTLVKLLAGLYAAESGAVTYNGVPAHELALDALRERMGLVTQDAQLFAGSVRDNLAFVRPSATDEECHEVLRQAAVTGLLARGGQGLDTRVGEGGITVSGGEKQRLAIARALLRRPELLVFDEATSSLDSITEEEVSRTIASLDARRDAITILIAHRLSTVRHADRIYVLDRGEIAEVGRHEALVGRGGLYAELWRRQTGARPPGPPAAPPAPAAAG